MYFDVANSLSVRQRRGLRGLGRNTVESTVLVAEHGGEGGGLIHVHSVPADLFPTLTIGATKQFFCALSNLLRFCVPQATTHLQKPAADRTGPGVTPSRPDFSIKGDQQKNMAAGTPP